MTKTWINTLFIIAIITSFLYIDGVMSLRSGRKVAMGRLRLSRREFAAPDAEKAVSTAETGIMGLLAALQHTVDNEYKLMQAKPAAAPTSAANNNATVKMSPGFSDDSSASEPAKSSTDGKTPKTPGEVTEGDEEEGKEEEN